MNIIQRIIWHVTKHRILSQTTIFLMSLSILLISIFSLYNIFSKKKNYGRNMALVGVTIRVLMLIAFTVEFYHQMSIYPLRGAKEGALKHLNYLLLLGYIVVVGIYYISTIRISKYRGFFYTFDIGMLIIPIFNIFPILVSLVFEGYVEQVIEGIVFISMMIVSIYLFFRMYWKQNVSSYILLFTVTIFPMILFTMLGAHDIEYNPVFIIQIFLILLGLYEGARRTLSSIIKKKNIRFQKYQYVLSIFPILLIFLANPFYNIWHLGTDLGEYDIKESFHKGLPLTNLKQAEEVARIATGNTEDEIMARYSINENFHNGYDLQIGDYHVQVHSAERVLLTVNRKNDYKMSKNRKALLSKEDIKKLSIDWLSRVGLTFDPKEVDIKIKEEADCFKVYFNKKFTDGSRIDENIYGYIDNSFISWYKDGTLAGFSKGDNFLGIDSYSKKILDNLDVKKIVENWYFELGENPHPYAIIYEGFGMFPGDPYRLEIRMKNKDLINLNENGEVVTFTKGSIADEDAFHGSYEEGLVIAEKYLKNICKEWERYDLKVFNGVRSKNNKGYYEFIYPIDELNSYYIGIGLNSNGELMGFNKGKKFTNIREDLVKNDFPISRKKAIDLVKKYYKPFEIYNMRVMMSYVTNSHENYKYNWMIVVFPFGKPEHHVYFIDPYTGNINDVYGYKDGGMDE